MGKDVVRRRRGGVDSSLTPVHEVGGGCCGATPPVATGGVGIGSGSVAGRLWKHPMGWYKGSGNEAGEVAREAQSHI